MNILPWLGLAIAISGLTTLVYTVVLDIRGQRPNGRVFRFRNVAWALILSGAAIAIGSIAFRDSPLLALVVIATFGLLLLRRLALSRDR